jgi:pimeloyl-ACP methyl ester carboxylesterase
MLLDTFHKINTGILRLRGFESSFRTTSVGTLHVMSGAGRGEGPPVVIVHGLGARASTFQRVAPPLLALHRRVSLVEQLGHGDSDRPDVLDGRSLSQAIVEVLAEVSDADSLVYGTSLGAVTVLRFALAHPDRLAGLLLVAPGGAPQGLDELVRTFSVNSRADAAGLIARVMTRPSVLRWVVAGGTLRNFQSRAIRSLLQNARPEDLISPDELRAVGAPLRVLWGRREHLLPPSHLAWWREHLPSHGELRLVESGHSPHLDRPRMVLAEIADFVASIPRASGTR